MIGKALLALSGALSMTLASGTALAAEAAQATAAAQTQEAELSGLDRLLAMEHMKNLRLTFCRALDSHDWPALRATMADDFELYWTDNSGPGGAAARPPIQMKGADKFIQFAQQILSRGKSIHVCTMPQFTHVGKDRARALWFINGYGQIGELSGIGYERVVEDYVRVNGKWLIQKANANIEVQDFTAGKGGTAAAPPAPATR